MLASRNPDGQARIIGVVNRVRTDDGSGTAAVDRVRDATDIAAVIGETVTLRRRGQKLWGLCPFHAEKSPSFSVDPARQLFYCFGCQVGGNVFTFLMRRDGKSFPEALAELADRAGIALPDRVGQRGGRRTALLAVLSAAQQYFRQALLDSGGQVGRAYLERRGLPASTVSDFGLGWAPDEWEGLLGSLRRLGYPVADVVEAGLAVERDRGAYDRLRGRITFPIRDPDGRVVGFGGRAVVDDAGVPKYLNTPETAVYHKGRILYGADRARAAWSEGRAPIIVEGYMDVLAMHRAGLFEAVGSLGTALTVEHVRYLRRFTSEVVCAYDQDPAGQEAMRRAFMVLAAEGIAVSSVDYQTAKDADELLSAKGPEALVAAVQGRMPYLARRIRDGQAAVHVHPEAKARAVREMRELLDAMADAVERTEYAALLERAWGVEQKILSQPSRAKQGPAGNNSEKTRHNMRRSEVNLGPQGVEVNLLASLIQFPDLMEGVLAALPELCRDPRWEAIRDHWPALAQEGAASLATWMVRLPPAAQELVTAAAAVPWPVSGDLVMELAQQVKTQWREREWRHLKSVADPDDPVVSAEISQLFQEISASKRAPRREG